MKKLLLVALVLALFLYGAITTQAALVNLSWIYDTVENTLQPAKNAVTARIMGAFFTGTSTTSTSTFINASTTNLVARNFNDTLYADHFPGADIGAKVMAAYATLPSEGGKIVITASSTFSTPMLFETANKHVLLECDPGVVLNYTGTGSSTVFATFVYPDYPSDAGIDGCTFDGPSGSTVVGISLGNSAGGAAGYNFRNFVVKDFGYNIVFGANTYLTSMDNWKSENGNSNLLVYAANNSGENLRFSNGLIGDCKTIANCVYFATSSSASTLWEGMSLDNAQLVIAPGNFNFNIAGGHCENPAAASSVIGKYACIVNKGETTGINGLSVVNIATSSAQTPDAFIINSGYLNIFSASVWAANSISAPAFVSNTSAATVNVYGFNELGTSIDTIATSSVGFFIADNRNVGVGTSSPAGLFDVNGNAFFGSAAGTAVMTLRGGSGRNAIFSQLGSAANSPFTLTSNGALDFQVDSISRLNIGEFGDVLIGATTTAPTTTISRLTVGSLTGLLKGTAGLVSVATPGTDYVANVTGDWTGTFDGQEGSYYLARANHTGTQSSTTITGLGTLAGFSVVPLATHVSGVLPEANGGTNQSTYTTGDMLYASGANTLAKRAIGSLGNVLSVVGGAPTWVSTSSLNIAGGGGSGTVNSGTTGQMARYNSAGTAVTGTSTVTVADNGNVQVGNSTVSPNIPFTIERDSPAGYTSANIYNPAADGRAQWTFNVGRGSNYYDFFIGASGSSTANYPNTMEIGCGFAGCGMNLWTGGFLQGRMATSGNTGLGTTTNLVAKLALQATVYGQDLLTISSTTGATMFKFASSGNLGIGVARPATKLEVFSSSEALRIGANTNADVYVGMQHTGTAPRAFMGYSAGTGYAVLQGALNKGVQFGVNNNTFGSGIAMTITSGAFVGIGSTSPSTALVVVGTTTLSNGVAMPGLPANTAGNAICIVGTTVVNAGGTTCVTSSERFKQDITILNDWHDLLDIDVVSYNYKPEYADPVRDKGGKRLGFVAEQVAEIDPQLVQYDTEGNPLSVHFDGVLAKTVLAVQDLQKQIDTKTSSAQDKWQWGAIILLALVVIRQQLKLNKLIV